MTARQASRYERAVTWRGAQDGGWALDITTSADGHSVARREWWPTFGAAVARALGLADRDGTYLEGVPQ